MIDLNKIYLGDSQSIISEWPDEVIDCCVTSPPYWGLRDYGHNGQIGLEENPEKYVEKIVSLFREVRRVLKDDGTLFLSLGDSYAGSGGTGNQSKPSSGLKPKDLVGIPWLVAFALRSDGWYLRQDIIWSKPNPMPESVTDRCTKAHEYIFLLSKSQKYYFNHEAIKEPIADSSKARLAQDIENQKGSDRVPGKTNGTMKAVGSIQDRNKRSVWTVTTKPFKGAHFATFPEDLIIPCILAGSRPGGVILDPFMGAGTTAIVAKKNGRKFVGCELNPEYIEIAERRISQQYIF